MSGLTRRRVLFDGVGAMTGITLGAPWAACRGGPVRRTQAQSRCRTGATPWLRWPGAAAPPDGLLLELRTSHGALHDLEIELHHGRRRLAHHHLQRLALAECRVLLTMHGNRPPPAGMWSSCATATERSCAAPSAWADRARRVR